MNNESAYLKYLQLCEALDSPWKEVDLTALGLLEVIAIADAKDSPLTVTQAMELHTLGSPATLHRKLDQLRESGLINQIYSGKNRRTKYLVITNKAEKYFDQKGRAMLKASHGI